MPLKCPTHTNITLKEVGETGKVGTRDHAKYYWCERAGCLVKDFQNRRGTEITYPNEMPYSSFDKEHDFESDYVNDFDPELL